VVVLVECCGDISCLCRVNVVVNLSDVSSNFAGFVLSVLGRTFCEFVCCLLETSPT
jgi:hypothetical protein